MDAAQASASLESERALILARAHVGIASAWDSRRLGYANESAHPFELEVTALLGTGGGHALDQVRDAELGLEVATATRDAERDATFEASPLAELARDFALTALELDVLLAIAAPTLWGEIARLYGVLSNDPGRATVDELLVTQVLECAHERHDLAAALADEGALRRHGLVVSSGVRPRPFSTLEVHPVVAGRLCGRPATVPAAISIRSESTPLASLAVPPLAEILTELAQPPARAVRLTVRGRTGSGRRSVLAAFAALAHRSLALIELAALPHATSTADLRGLLRTASLAGMIPCVVGVAAEQGAHHETARRAIEDELAAHPGPVFAVVGPDERSPLPAEHRELVLPPLAASARLQHWRAALARHQLRVADLEGLAGSYRLAPGQVERAVAQVAREGGVALADATLALAEMIRRHRDERLARLATRVTRLPRWSEVVLPPDVLDSLRELIGRVRYGRRVYEDWGFEDVMTTGRGLTALFDGRPGTGKTMVAGVIARELGLDLYRVDLSRVVSKWIGETERHLGEIFDAVDDGQAIVLFDEADSLFARRTDVKSSNDRHANLEVNYLLQRIDSFEGIAILTTNFGGAIDPAFRRRISLRLSFPFPDEEAREHLWRVHLPARLPIEGELDLAALARRYQLAGGYIRNACLRAAFLAAQEDGSLTQHHLERAVQLEYQQIGKISTSGPVD